MTERSPDFIDGWESLKSFLITNFSQVGLFKALEAEKDKRPLSRAQLFGQLQAIRMVVDMLRDKTPVSVLDKPQASPDDSNPVY